jgi:hypothetical protein
MKTFRLATILFVFAVALSAQQPSAAVLEITGDVAHPRIYQEQEWKALKHISVSATNAHEKKTSTLSGVLLRDLLKEAGVPSGENLRGKVLTTCIVITASDGYQVTFSIAELDEGIGNLQVLVADSEDGKPLAQNLGPLRLVVPADKRPARWVRMVKTIRVVANPSTASPQ